MATNVFVPNLLIVERIFTQQRNPANPEAPLTEIGFGAWGLHESESDYILPAGEFAVLKATGFDKHGFPKGYEQRKKRPRLVVGQTPSTRTLEPLT